MIERDLNGTSISTVKGRELPDGRGHPTIVRPRWTTSSRARQIETNITYHLEWQFTLASRMDHMESHSLPGVSLIKVYFRSGTDPDAADAAIQLEGIVRSIVTKHDMGMIVSNIGVNLGSSALYSPNSAIHTGFLLVGIRAHLLAKGQSVREAITTSCRVRLRPILMTSLATLIGLLPMTLNR